MHPMWFCRCTTRRSARGCSRRPGESVMLGTLRFHLRRGAVKPLTIAIVAVLALGGAAVAYKLRPHKHKHHHKKALNDATGASANQPAAHPPAANSPTK